MESLEEPDESHYLVQKSFYQMECFHQLIPSIDCQLLLKHVYIGIIEASSIMDIVIDLKVFACLEVDFTLHVASCA